MIIAVCDPKGIAIEAIKTILYHDKGLSDRISRIYEFWNMEQLLDASRDSSFDCIVFPNYCNSHNSVVCSLSCGYNRFPLVEHDPRYTLIVRDILYWETARSLWTQYLKAIPGKEEKVKRAIRGILADYEKEERDIIYLESKNHCVLVHLDGIRQTPEGSPSFYGMSYSPLVFTITLRRVSQSPQEITSMSMLTPILSSRYGLICASHAS